MGSKIKGFNNVKKHLDKLAENPQQLLVGRTLEKPHEVACEFCGKEFVVRLPLKIERIEGTRGHASGGNVKAECPTCGGENEYTWGRAVINVTLTG